MKKYLIDQAMFLIAGIGAMICIPFLCGPIFTFVFEVLVAISWGYLCRRVLLLPLDLLFGKVTDNAYFATQLGLADYEFHKGKHCPEWKFTCGNKTLILLVPMAATKEAIMELKQPKKDEKLKITYFRFSKILLSYEPI
ncbi:MAG: hypothetical protein ACI4F7_00265 [Acutalibacteraceae bacterium]